VLRALHDPGIAARVTRRVHLHYEAGPDPLEDRPAHVRAASSIVRFHDELLVIQDDALFVARVDERTSAVGHLVLTQIDGGPRLFDDGRGNKADKLDLEAAVAVESRGEQLVLALGSGSTSVRERIVVLRRVADELKAEIVHAPDFYAMLRARPEFSGSELNLEGAVQMGSALLLFQRGNGAPGKVDAVDACASIDAQAFVDHLSGLGPCPELERVRQYDLGRVAGSRLTFTDATLHAGLLLYVAAAEASPDVTRDGPVAGVALGMLCEDEPPRYALLMDEHGSPCTDKLEGIVGSTLLAGSASAKVHEIIGVIDRDDPDVAAELVHIGLEMD